MNSHQYVRCSACALQLRVTTAVHRLASLVRPTPIFSVLRFPLTIIHGYVYGRRIFCHPSTSVYYCQRKPKNRKNGVGLGTRL